MDAKRLDYRIRDGIGETILVRRENEKTTYRFIVKGEIRTVYDARFVCLEETTP